MFQKSTYYVRIPYGFRTQKVATSGARGGVKPHPSPVTIRHPSPTVGGVTRRLGRCNHTAKFRTVIFDARPVFGDWRRLSQRNRNTQTDHGRRDAHGPRDRREAGRAQRGVHRRPRRAEKIIDAARFAMQCPCDDAPSRAVLKRHVMWLCTRHHGRMPRVRRYRTMAPLTRAAPAWWEERVRIRKPRLHLL